MEIILLKDMETLGLANSLVSVKPGYARNYLIPQGFAVAATARNKNVLMKKIKQQEERAAQLLGQAKELAQKLAETKIRVAVKAGASGKIFGSVNQVQIAQAINDLLGLSLERKQVVLTEEVKMVGTYTADIHLHKDVKAALAFEVYDDRNEIEAAQNAAD